MASICSQNVILLTLTCNQKGHPGVALLKKAIEEKFANATAEEKEIANQAYMTTCVRKWSRAVKYVSELLLNKNLKLWGRVEFRTIAGNLQHYQFLIWLVESIECVDLIQCSEKHVCFVQNSGDVNLYDECVRLHTHNCEQTAGRCKKRKDSEGNKICRTPPYPPTHSHCLMDIETRYRDELLKICRTSTCDVAEPIPRTAYGMRPGGILNCNKK